MAILRQWTYTDSHGPYTDNLDDLLNAHKLSTDHDLHMAGLFISTTLQTAATISAPLASTQPFSVLALAAPTISISAASSVANGYMSAADKSRSDTYINRGFIDNNITTQIGMDLGSVGANKFVIDGTPTHSFVVWYYGSLYYATGPHILDMTALAAGSYWLYYASAAHIGTGTISAAASCPAWTTAVPIAQVYKSATSAYLVWNERHTIVWQPNLHKWAHNTFGACIDKDNFITTVNASGQLIMATASKVSDDDLEYNIAAKAAADATLYIFYRVAGPPITWTWTSLQATIWILNAGRLRYDNAGTLTDVADGQYVNYYTFGSNLQTGRIIGVMGQTVYATQSQAESASINGISLIDIGTKEWAILAKYTCTMTGGVPSIVNTQDLRTSTTTQINATQIIIPNNIGTPVSSTVADWMNYTRSSGRYTGGTVSAGAVDTISITPMEGMIFTGATLGSAIVHFSIGQQTNISPAGLTATAVNWIYLDYTVATGVLSYKATTVRSSINDYNQFVIGRCWYPAAGSLIEVQASGHSLYNKDRRVHNRLILKYGGMDHVSGSTIVNTVTRDIAIDLGNWYTANTPFTTPASGAAALITLLYKTGGVNTWIEKVLDTPNAWSTLITGARSVCDSYQNTVGHALVASTRWTVYWVFQDPLGKIYIILHTIDYPSSTTAATATVPSVLPARCTEWAVLIGRVILDASAPPSALLYEVSSRWTTSYALSAATDHQSLSNRSDTDTHPAASITNTAVGTIVATDVQAAINELDTEKIPYPTSATSGNIAIFNGSKAVIDSAIKTVQVGSAVNFIQITDAATTSSPIIEAVGTATDLYVLLRGKGGNGIAVQCGSTYVMACVSYGNINYVNVTIAKGTPVFSFDHRNSVDSVAGAVIGNIEFLGAWYTGGLVDRLSANIKAILTGTPSSTSMASYLSFLTSADTTYIPKEVLRLAASVVSAVNNLQITNAIAGGGPILGAIGTDTDININLVPKGIGCVKIPEIALITTPTKIAILDSGLIKYRTPTEISLDIGNPSTLYNTGLVVWYKGDSLSDSISGGVNNLTAGEGAVAYAANKWDTANKAFSFDGTNALHMHANVFTDDCTISFEIMATAPIATWSRMMAFGQAADANNQLEFHTEAAGTSFVEGNGKIGGVAFPVFYPDQTGFGAWSNITLVFNKTMGVYTIYKNGTSQQNGVAYALALSALVSDIFVLGSDIAYANNFKGRICHFRIWNRAMTSGEVYEMYIRQMMDRRWYP